MFQVTYTKNHRMHIDMNSNDSNKDKILIVFKKLVKEGMTSGHLTNIKLNLLNLHLQKSRCLTYIRYVKT